MNKRLLTLFCNTVLATTMLVGCGSKPAEVTVSGDVQNSDVVQTQEVAVSGDKEAPMLKALVDQGELPDVEERLPADGEAMLETMDSVGTYGGSFKFAYTKAGWNTGKPIEEGLFRFKEDGTVEPNVAKGYDVNEDATLYTIYLREGMKWSDGEDFTAEDCVFFYDYMCLPETFGKSLWDCFKVANPEDSSEETKAVFTLIDQYTFTVAFEYPKPGFIENLAINAKWCYAPKHYMLNVLPEFIGEEKAQALATEMGYSDVVSMLKDTGYYFWNVPGIPTLNSYVLSTEEGKSDVNGDYYEFVRNPYYWKVDEEGKQLPYIDNIEITRIADASQALLLTLQGDITISSEMGWADIGTLQENTSKGDYKIVQWANGSWAAANTQLHLNLTHKDEDVRALFNDKDFRQALSIGVDREEYAALLSDGWSAGKQASPSKGLLGYSEEWESQWTEYDVTQAKALLEGCGLAMGADGYYDFENGKDFVLNLSTYTDSGSDESAELLMKYYGELGIKTTYKPVDRDLLNNMTTSNDFDAVIGPVVPAETVSIILRPDTLVPVRNYAAWYSQYGNWYASKGAEGVEPTGDLLELCNLYDQLKSTVGEKEQISIAEDMLKLHQENQWIIGYMEALPNLITVDNKLANFVEESIFCDEYRGLGIAHIQTCYFTEQ